MQARARVSPLEIPSLREKGWRERGRLVSRFALAHALASPPPLSPHPRTRTPPPPRRVSSLRRSVIFCEATAIYGVILSIILTNKVVLPDAASLPQTVAGWKGYYIAARYAGYAVFWSGLGVGLTNLGSGCVGEERGVVLCSTSEGCDPHHPALCPHLIPLQDLRRRRGRGVRSCGRARLDALCQDPDRRNLWQRARHFRGHCQVCHSVAIAHSGLPASPSPASVTLSALSGKRQARSTSTITSPPPSLYSTCPAAL